MDVHRDRRTDLPHNYFPRSKEDNKLNLSLIVGRLSYRNATKLKLDLRWELYRHVLACAHIGQN